LLLLKTDDNKMSHRGTQKEFIKTSRDLVDAEKLSFGAWLTWNQCKPNLIRNASLSTIADFHFEDITASSCRLHVSQASDAQLSHS